MPTRTRRKLGILCRRTIQYPGWRCLRAFYGQLAEKAEKGGRLPAYWEALQRAHPWARNLIGNLFNGGWVVVRNKDLKLEDHWALTLEKNREVKQHFSAPDVQDEI